MSADLENVIPLLQVANTSSLGDPTFKELLETCFIELVDLESKSITHLYNSKPDLIKELQAAFLTAISQFIRNSFTKESLKEFLKIKCKYADNRVELFAKLYEKYLIRLQVKMGNIGSHLPSIVDIEIKTKPHSSIGDPDTAIFQVSLITEKYDESTKSKKTENVDFSCTMQETLDLTWKLKDICRHCCRIADV